MNKETVLDDAELAFDEFCRIQRKAAATINDKEKYSELELCKQLENAAEVCQKLGISPWYKSAKIEAEAKSKDTQLIDLVQIIKDNPGCIAVIDNDGWDLFDEERDLIVDSSDTFHTLGAGGYGTGSNYGGDILQALAKIVVIKIESV